MAMDRDSRAQRIMNVAISLGVLTVLSFMSATPRNGPGGFIEEWVSSGLPLLLLGCAIIALRAPRYIRGEGAQ
jgi:hypothetical protein